MKSFASEADAEPETLTCASLFDNAAAGTEGTPPSEPVALGLNYRAPTFGI